MRGVRSGEGRDSCRPVLWRRGICGGGGVCRGVDRLRPDPCRLTPESRLLIPWSQPQPPWQVLSIGRLACPGEGPPEMAAVPVGIDSRDGGGG